MPLSDLLWAMFWLALFIGFVALIIFAARALIRISRRRGGGWKAWSIAAGVFMVLLPLIGLQIAGVIVLVEWLQRRNSDLSPATTPLPVPHLAPPDEADAGAVGPELDS